MQDRMCKAMFERDNKEAFLQRFEQRQKNQQVDNNFPVDKKLMKSLNGDANDYCQLEEADGCVIKNLALNKMAAQSFSIKRRNSTNFERT